MALPHSDAIRDWIFNAALPWWAVNGVDRIHGGFIEQVTPDGRFLYASERGTSTIAGFAVDSTDGSLKPLGNTPTEQVPRGFAIDPTGKYLLAVDGSIPTLSTSIVSAERAAGNQASSAAVDSAAMAVRVMSCVAPFGVAKCSAARSTASMSN